MRCHPLMSVALVGSAALLSGCEHVPREPVWLPDSSGFIYTTDKGHVVHCDVGNRESRTLVKNDAAATNKSSTSIPAISPDGKRVALLRAISGGKGSVQLRVHELASGRLLQSHSLSLAAVAVNDCPKRNTTFGAIWSPCGKHVLFWFVDRDFEVRCGHFEAATGVGKIFDTVEPAVNLWAYRLSPMSDDGRGFLTPRKDAGWFFVEFDGPQHLLKETARAKKFFSEITQLRRLPRGHWKQGVARIAIGSGWLVIDTVTHSIDYQANKQLTKQREKAIRENLLFEVPIGPANYVVRCKKTGQTAHVELFDAGTDKATLLGTINTGSDGIAAGRVPQPIITSPDGRRVIVTCRANDGIMKWTLIDESGEILVTVPVPSFTRAGE